MYDSLKQNQIVTVLTFIFCVNKFRKKSNRVKLKVYLENQKKKKVS